MSDRSKGPWTIRELAEGEYPGTQLRYEIRDAEGEVVSLHHWEEDAKLVVQIPSLVRALSTAKHNIQTALFMMQEEQ